MSAITPILDTLLPQVLGRRADLERLATLFPRAPVGPVRRVGENLPLDTRLPNPTHVQRGGESTQTSAATSANARAQPSFAVTGGGAQTAGARAQAAAGAPAMAAHSSSQASPQASSAAINQSTSLHLTRAGDVLAGVLARFANAPLARPAGNSALVDGRSRPGASVLAALLAGEVSQSGVFYESHVSRWLRGRYPADALAREPQARLAALAQRAQAVEDDADQAQHTRQHPSNAQPGSAIDSRMASLVRQQMEVLSTGAFQWQGEVWPGAMLDWEIRETDDQAADSASQNPADDPGAGYMTSLRLVLPALGEVEVRISLKDHDVSVHAHALDDTARRLIRRDAGTLRSRLIDAGFKQADVALLAAGGTGT